VREVQRVEGGVQAAQVRLHARGREEARVVSGRANGIAL
jgi:hypothetical protein